VKIELPWPNPILFPNRKAATHWSKVGTAAKQARFYAWAMATQAGAKGKIQEVAFYPPDRRTRDDDGMIGAFKHYRDGIADATKIDDKHYRPTYHFLEPVAGGRIVVTVGE
jgi:crossover junction endodeoxyribonuclease RusA